MYNNTKISETFIQQVDQLLHINSWKLGHPPLSIDYG